MGPVLGFGGGGDPLFELMTIGEEHVFHFATLCVGILCVCLGWWLVVWNSNRGQA